MTNMKEWTLIFVWVVGLAVLLALGSYAWKYFMAPVAGKANAEWQIESAGNRITSYERFFNQCAAVQGMETAVAEQRQLLAHMRGDDHQRIQINLSGLIAQRARLIAQYNVDVQKEYTAGRFHSTSLPVTINVQQERTVCLIQ